MSLCNSLSKWLNSAIPVSGDKPNSGLWMISYSSTFFQVGKKRFPENARAFTIKNNNGNKQQQENNCFSNEYFNNQMIYFSRGNKSGY